MMGAAIVLDSPADGYTLRFVKQMNTAPWGGMFPDFDNEGIERSEDVFEKQCRNRCLELAAAAANLDPTNVEWWRLYALLLRRCPTYSHDDAPRDPDWLRILGDCAQHDPDNALYDYLASDFYWRAAAAIDFSGAKERLVIKDGDKFARGIARFEQGQSKRYFAVGDTGFTAVAEIPSATQIPLTDHERIVNSSGIQLRRDMLLRDVLRWQDARAAERISEDDPRAALKLYRQNLRLIDQYQAVGASTAYDQIAIICRVATTSQIQTIVDTLKGTMSESERQKILADHEEAILQQEIATRAAQNLVQSNSTPTAATGTPGVLAWGKALVVGIAPSLVVLLFLFGLLATILSRRAADDGLPTVGLVGQVSTFAVAVVTTVVLFGLAPAEIINRDIQSWFFTVVLLLIPVFVVSRVGWCWFRRRAFQFSIGEMLTFTFIVSLFCSLMVVVRSNEAVFSSFPFPLSMPARGWQGVTAGVYASAITTTYGQWPWAFFQWAVYQGPCLTLALWAVLLVVLYGRRVRRMQRERNLPLPEFGNRLRGVLRTLARPALVMSALMLVVYLVLAPGTLDQAEQEFQKKMMFARHPETHWSKVAKAVQKVRSDEKLMGELKEFAKAEAAKPAIPDSER